MLSGKKIILDTTGSIATYKACYIIRGLIKQGTGVQVIVTPVGKEFVTSITLSALTSKPVISELFAQQDGTWDSHIDLGLWADAMLIASAMVSTIGKVANDIADNMLITTYLSAKAPVFIAPTVDSDMFARPSTQKNLGTLRSYGNHVTEPVSGELASHLVGKGRMEEPKNIIWIFDELFSSTDELAGKRVLITVGPTYERIDPVRFIGNYSSGKIGFILAEECARRGAEVVLIAGPVQQGVYHLHITRTDVESAQEMYKAVMVQYTLVDAGVSCAAVVDFTPDVIADEKIKWGEDDLVLYLKPTHNITAASGKPKTSGQKLIGFALETSNEQRSAEEKLIRKNFDLIVLNSLNDVGAGPRHNTNKISILSCGGRTDYPLKSKAEVARDTVDRMIKEL